MKKAISVLFLICIMISTMSFAAYEEPTETDTENSEYGIELINIDPDEEGESIVRDPVIQPRDGDSENTSTTIYDDVYKIENNVTITDIVDGNVYVMGKNVNIDGATIFGDLYIIGETVNITDVDVGSSVYVIGQDVKFSGMTNDLYVLGQNVDIEEGASIWRSVRAGAETLNFAGYIDRNLYAAVNNLTVSESGIIQGTLNYSSENEGDISENASISDIQFSKEVDENEETTPELKEYVFQLIRALVKTLGVSCIIVLLVNKFKTINRTDKISNDLLKQFGKGILVFVAVPVLAILLFITKIGIALGFPLVVIYLIYIYIATSIAMTEIAYRILLKNPNDELTNKKIIGVSVIVSAVVWLIGLIPFVGIIVKSILGLIGLGISYDLIFQKNKKIENE